MNPVSVRAFRVWLIPCIRVALSWRLFQICQDGWCRDREGRSWAFFENGYHQGRVTKKWSNFNTDLYRPKQVTDGVGGSPGLATQQIGKVSSSLVESVNADLSQVNQPDWAVSTYSVQLCYYVIVYVFISKLTFAHARSHLNWMPVFFRLAPLLTASNS